MDISGFTALSEQLAHAHGDEGAELLQSYTNTYLERLITVSAAIGSESCTTAVLHTCNVDSVSKRVPSCPRAPRTQAVHTYHGDILKFAGDAFIVLWRHFGDDRSSSALSADARLAQLIEQATACSLNLLSEFDHFEVEKLGAEGVGGAPLQLRLHVGVAAGEVSFVVATIGQKANAEHSEPSFAADFHSCIHAVRAGERVHPR